MHEQMAELTNGPHKGTTINRSVFDGSLWVKLENGDIWSASLKEQMNDFFEHAPLEKKE